MIKILLSRNHIFPKKLVDVSGVLLDGDAALTTDAVPAFLLAIRNSELTHITNFQEENSHIPKVLNRNIQFN